MEDHVVDLDKLLRTMVSDSARQRILANMGRVLGLRQQEIRSRTDMPKEKEVHVLEVVRHDGDALTIPNSMTLEQVQSVIAQKIKEEETFVNFHGSVPASPYDGAYAMSKALERLFGVSTAKVGFWTQAHRISVEVDAQGGTVQVPWGKFEVPGVEGTIGTDFTFDDGRVIFSIDARIKGKHKRQFDQLLTLTKEIVANESIYRRKSIRVKFSDDDGSSLPMPEIKFINVSKAIRPIFSATLEDQLDYDVTAYITQHSAIKKLQGGVLKRGVLLAGVYGTGKTLTANYVAKLAEENGFTFIYAARAQDIPSALDFARTYQPAVVFAEDVESVAGGERTHDVNRILNKLDGVDSKKDNIMAIFTTNHIRSINAAMLRPGRIDVVMILEPPDAEASIRVARHYAVNMVDEEYETAGRLLDGMIPARIQEAVRRAQIRALSRTGGKDATINNEDLTAAAHSVLRELTATTQNDFVTDPIEKLGNAFGNSFGNAVGRSMELLMEGRPLEPNVQRALAPGTVGGGGSSNGH